MGKGKNGCDGDMAMSSMLPSAASDVGQGPEEDLRDYSPYSRPDQSDLKSHHPDHLASSGGLVAIDIPEGAPSWIANAVQQYFVEGQSLRDIGARNGVDKETVRYWFVKAGLPRREPNDDAPTRYEYDPESSSALLRRSEVQDAMERAQANNDMTSLIGARDNLHLLSAPRVWTSHTKQGPFGHPEVLEYMSLDLFRTQEHTGLPVAEFAWEKVASDSLSLYPEYDSVELMSNKNNKGRDAKVIHPAGEFGISYKSEYHQRVGPDNTRCRVAHFMSWANGTEFGPEVKKYLDDSRFILNLRSYTIDSPQLGPTRCYRVYGIPSSRLEFLLHANPDRKLNKQVTTRCPTGNGDENLSIQVAGDDVALQRVPLALGSLFAAFYLPLAPSDLRGNDKL